MASLFETDVDVGARAKITPRPYQVIAHDSAFALWAAGSMGVLIRSATGTGKTLMAALIADTWLRRSDHHRVIVVSYETQLVYQFAQELEDWLGIKPGIEMDTERIEADAVPLIVVASRQSLLVADPPTEEHRQRFSAFGIADLGAMFSRAAKSFLKKLYSRAMEPEDVKRNIDLINQQPEASNGLWSRVHKFDPKLNWLVVSDEAHRHAYHLKSVGHIADWFATNPESRRLGLTATPKRSDGVSIGDVMFPGIALDYPLYSPERACAVRDGWAVPYIQRYIEVEGVDFKQLKQIAGDFDEGELERILGEEKMLAKLCIPMLEMVGDRRTLIFSPGVEMAKAVAAFINARRQCKCVACSFVSWQSAKLLENSSARCKCGEEISREHITKEGEQACEVDGNTPWDERQKIYKGHQSGRFQFLSVVGLCKEGYNDPDISCVAIFRPISKKASSLAEQIKGRSCRIPRWLIPTIMACKSAEERVELLKPHASLIIDLVGVTGLADCASTVAIYADGKPDEIVERAEQILAEEGLVGEVDVQGAIDQAEQEARDTKEKVRKEREAAEEAARQRAAERAKADAEVKYTVHERGQGSNLDPAIATDGQYSSMERWGMKISVVMHKARAGRIIDQLQRGVEPSEIARTNQLHDGDWQLAGPSPAQLGRYGSLIAGAKSKREAGLLIDAKYNQEALIKGAEFKGRRLAGLLEEIQKSRSNEELTARGKDVHRISRIAPSGIVAQLIEAGHKRRQELRQAEEPIPE